VPFNLSAGEIMVVMLVALLLFGGRLPEMARKFGSGVAEFRRGIRDEARKLEREVKDVEREAEKPPPEWNPPASGADCSGFGPNPPPSNPQA